MAPRKLTLKQQRFVDEYLSDPNLNATRAYRRAYPACKTDDAAGAAAARLLGTARVKEAIAAAQAARSARTEVDADWVLTRLREQATLTGEGSSHSARVAALKLLGSHLGMFPKRLEHTGRHGGPVEAEVRSAEDMFPSPEAVRIFIDNVMNRPDPGTNGQHADGTPGNPPGVAQETR